MQLLGLGWTYNGQTVTSITRQGIVAGGKTIPLSEVKLELCGNSAG